MEIIEQFKEKYSHLIRAGMKVHGLADIMGEPIIAAEVPFIFDRRMIPMQFEGCYIKASVLSSSLRLPPSPLRETSAETLYIFQLYALMKEKRRPGKDGKISIKCMMG